MLSVLPSIGELLVSPRPPPAPLFGDIVKSTGVQAYDQMSDFNYFSYSLINAWWRVTYLFPEAA